MMANPDKPKTPQLQITVTPEHHRKLTERAMQRWAETGKRVWAADVLREILEKEFREVK